MAEMIIMSFYDQRAINIRPFTINEFSSYYQPPLISTNLYHPLMDMKHH